MEKGNDKKKKSLFGSLIKVTKPKKSSCCSFEIEEIPENDDKKEKKSDKDGCKPCCS